MRSDRPHCNLCGGEGDVLFTAPPAVLRCRRCGLMSLVEFPDKPDREECYQEAYYDGESGERFTGFFERLVRVFRRLRMCDILRREPGPASVLDVGCGRGTLLELFMKRGWRVAGTQVSRTAAAAARKRGVRGVVVGELPAVDLPAGGFRVVTFYHVLEHVSQPEQYLKRTRDLLENGGLLIVEVPNHAGIAFKVLGKRHFCFDYPNHLIFFTPASLTGLLATCGFRVEGARFFSLEYSPYTTLQNLLNLLPGESNRLYRSFMLNDEGRRLRRMPTTWLHLCLALVLAVPALCISATGLLFPAGNTLRVYCRKSESSTP